jgi:hypothetical protein
MWDRLPPSSGRWEKTAIAAAAANLEAGCGR